MNHRGKRLCITGIPTSGKSTLAKRLAEEISGTAVHLDDLREELATDETYKKWVHFYLDQDQETYHNTYSPEEKRKHLVEQSEALWPAFYQKIESYKDVEQPVIFECVNLLPHLVHQHLAFPCIVLVTETYEEVFKRNTKSPRWGGEKKLIEMNSKDFFFVERPYYIEEAKKYNDPVCSNMEDAYKLALNFLQ